MSSAAPTAPVETGTPSLWRTGPASVVIAALATTAVAAMARVLDVPLEVAGEEIPLLGFAVLTLLFGMVGVLIASALARWTHHPRTAFVRTTVGLTVLSVLPDLTADATAATKVTLVLTHLVAAAIVIPCVAAHLAS